VTPNELRGQQPVIVTRKAKVDALRGDLVERAGRNDIDPRPSKGRDYPVEDRT
jgi:hypothetical protein